MGSKKQVAFEVLCPLQKMRVFIHSYTSLSIPKNALKSLAIWGPPNTPNMAKQVFIHPQPIGPGSPADPTATINSTLKAAGFAFGVYPGQFQSFAKKS